MRVQADSGLVRSPVRLLGAKQRLAAMIRSMIVGIAFRIRTIVRGKETVRISQAKMTGVLAESLVLKTLKILSRKISTVSRSDGIPERTKDILNTAIEPVIRIMAVAVIGAVIAMNLQVRIVATIERVQILTQTMVNLLVLSEQVSTRNIAIKVPTQPRIQTTAVPKMDIKVTDRKSRTQIATKVLVDPMRAQRVRRMIAIPKKINLRVRIVMMSTLDVRRQQTDLVVVGRMASQVVHPSKF